MMFIEQQIPLLCFQDELLWHVWCAPMQKKKKKSWSVTILLFCFFSRNFHLLCWFIRRTSQKTELSIFLLLSTIFQYWPTCCANGFVYPAHREVQWPNEVPSSLTHSLECLNLHVEQYVILSTWLKLTLNVFEMELGWQALTLWNVKLYYAVLGNGN